VVARRREQLGWAEPELLILRALAGGPLHGYGIVGEVRAQAGAELGPGTLYAALARLEEQGFVEALPAEDRRRPYRATAAGRAALAERLATMQRFARSGLAELRRSPA
jgi:DNA-binding PadR family transcriptional regulator